MMNETDTGPNILCRMYEQKYPELDDLVVVHVNHVTEMGAYVKLLEYNNIEGMIMSTEYSRRRIRSISQVIRVGKQEVAVVMRVDEDKGYIDLSKRRVTPEDITKCEEKYSKSKEVHSIMKYVAEVTKTDLENLYLDFGWPLYRKFGHAYTAFKQAIQDPTIFDQLEKPIEGPIKEALLKEIRRRLTPQAEKLRADIEVTCFHYDGIDAIKHALSEGEKVGIIDEKQLIKIKLVAPPLFVMVSTSLEKDKGIELLNASIAKIKEEIEKFNGSLVIKNAPRSVSEREDQELSQQLERLEQMNKQVDGDDDVSSGEETEDE
jgi:translation initiation factor 2 subunit 1